MTPLPATRALRAAAAVAAAALALAGPGACKKEPLRVGFVSGLTGRNYNLGISSRNAAAMAVEAINAAGGVHGRPIELVVHDDEQRPEAARQAVEELIRLGVLAIIGHNTSAMAEATLPLANAAHVLMVSPTVSSSRFVGLDDWLVMLYPSTAESAMSLADYIARAKAARRVSVIWDQSNAAYATALAEAFQVEHRARGGAIVRALPYTSGQVASFADLAAEALREETDGVLVVANAVDSATLCQQLRKLSASVRLFGADWGFTADVLAHGGAAVEGAVFTQKVDVEDTSPAYVAFKQAYTARYHRPVDFAAVLAWDAAQVVAEGLRRDATREGLRRAVLEIGTFHGLQGDFRIDKFGDVQRRHLVTTIRDGRMTAVE